MCPKKNTADAFIIQPFKDLKNILERKKKKTSPHHISKEGKLPLSDEELFTEAMKEVKEIEEFRNIPVYQRKTAVSQRKKSADSEVITALEDTVRGRKSIHLPDTQEYIEWVHPDYREDIIKRLHEGRYSVRDTLDVHGLVLHEAEEEVDRFIRNSLKKRHHCIKIIHGRGLRSPKGPVLKDAVVHWLSRRYRKYVIAFVSARQCDSGLGAVYVLLRRVV